MLLLFYSEKRGPFCVYACAYSYTLLIACIALCGARERLFALLRARRISRRILWIELFHDVLQIGHFMNEHLLLVLVGAGAPVSKTFELWKYL